MIKKVIFFCFASLVLLNCEGQDERNTNPVSIQKEWLKYEVGQTWTYRRMFINEGVSELMNVPDTLYGYSNFIITKDTVFEDNTWMIADGKDYDCGEDSIYEYISRYAFSFTDTSLKVYQFDLNSYGFSWGLFKRGDENINIERKDFVNIKSISTKILAKRINAVDYDPAIFSDLLFPLVFNVDSGYTWFIRQENDPNGNTPIEKVYMGREIIEVPAGLYNSYKFELLSGEALGISDIHIFSWYSEKSLIKRVIDTGTNEIFNDSGEVIGTVESRDIFVYLGPGEVDKDTLVPWGQRSQ